MRGVALGLALLGAAQAATSITTTDTNLRRTPDGMILRVIPKNTLLTVACQGNWCRTSYRGRGGYVYSPLLKSLTRSVPLSGTFYASCSAMRARGVGPIRLGQPGYRVGLDSNMNTLACDRGDR